MARLDGTPRKRVEIADGQLVASTNSKQYGCIRALGEIIHRYRCRNYKRLKRFVKNSNIEDNENVKEK